METIVRRLLPSVLLCCAALLPAQDRSSQLINGSYTSSFDVENRRTYPGGGGAFAQGWSNVANLRLKSSVSEALSLYVSANVTAPTGFYAEALGSEVRMELERLYFKAGNDLLDLEAGLIRVARGYGYVFSPLDFLSPRNATDSLDPQGRPPGRWGVHASWFPGDLWRIELFGLTGDDPAEDELRGSRLGAATTFSLDWLSCDALLALLLPETPPGSTPAPAYLSDEVAGVAGFALKADVEVGLFVEALYRFDRVSLENPYRGLEASCGADYTFGGIGLYLLGEYLFYGPGELDWGERLDRLFTAADWADYAPLDRTSLLDPAIRPQPFARHDYLFVLGRLTIAPDLKAGVSCLVGLDDASALVTAFAEYEVLQGLTLQMRYLHPLDRRAFDPDAAPGEWGSTALGFHQLVGIVVSVRF